MPWILLVCMLGGTALAVYGVVCAIRDARRISPLVFIALGASAAAFAAGILLSLRGHDGLLITMAIIMAVVLLAGTVIGYPLLVAVLLWAGITNLRRESRSVGNALALLLGIGLLVMPTARTLIEPPDLVEANAAFMARYAGYFVAVTMISYIAAAFSVFIAASVIYRFRRPASEPEAIIVLGSGLIDGRVPPLLASRLDRGLQAHREAGCRPVIITSGGQGPDEPRPEGRAMREYLIDQGVDPNRVIAEEESRNTRENLEFSRRFLSRPDAQVTVTSSSYHVFRTALLTRQLGMNAHVLGARTAWYFLPSAVLREFVGVLRDQRWLHMLVVAVLITLVITSTVILVPGMVPPSV